EQRLPGPVQEPPERQPEPEACPGLRARARERRSAAPRRLQRRCHGHLGAAEGARRIPGAPGLPREASASLRKAARAVLQDSLEDRVTPPSSPNQLGPATCRLVVAEVL